MPEDPTAIDHLRRAAELSDRLAVAAEAGDWEAATRLEAERRPLIDDAFAAGPPSDAEEAAALIQRILSADRRVASLASHARDEAAAELAALQKGRRMNKAYRDTER
jgi:hypothetical protein